MPKVSVLMPFYDDGRGENRRYFSQAIGSILGQTMKDFEIVAVVSGKREFAERMARRSGKIRLFFFEQKAIEGAKRPLSERKYGIITARNMCLEKARGRYLAYADYDDISLPQRLGRQLGFLSSHPEIGAVGSWLALIDSEGRGIGVRKAFESDAEIRRHLLQFNTVPQPSVMVRAELVRKAGGYRLGEFAEDYDLWVRMAVITKFHNLPEALVKYRVHPGGGASRYKLDVYFASLGVKRRASESLGIPFGPKDITVNAAQLASLFFPESLRRTALEKMRGKLVIGGG